MNDLQRYREPMPAALRDKIARLVPTRYPGHEAGDPGFRLAPRKIFHDPAADRFLARYRAECGPPDHRVVQTWLLKLSCAVSNAPTEQDAAARSSAVALACADLPAGVWTEETLAEAMRAFKFWPSVAEIYALLKPHAENLARTLSALRSIAEVPAEPELVKREPYVLPPPPPERPVSVPRGRDWSSEPPEHRPRLPIRTVAEQLEALGYTAAD